MTIKNQYTVSMPTWALGAIFNDDFTGLDDEDERLVRGWIKENPGTYDIQDEQEYFTHRPCIGLPMSCMELIVTQFENQ